MKILVFDNYDSFTYNLVHLVEAILGESVDVFRNNQISLADVNAYDKIILSPGPGIPKEAGLLLPLIKQYAPTKSLLGVCLGLQAITESFGGTLVNLDQVYHGVATNCVVTKPETLLFKDMPTEFEIGRYHSWAADASTFPDELEITAVDDANMIMALQHKTFDVMGVQFHPESVLTPLGDKIIRNWLGA